jgi:hypothetical protein
VDLDGIRGFGAGGGVSGSFSLSRQFCPGSHSLETRKAIVLQLEKTNHERITNNKYARSGQK